MELFLHRGLELLNPDTGVIYACFGYSVQDLVIGMKFQQLLSDLKLVVRTQLENFNTYLEAGSIGSTSHLYKLRPAQRIKLVPDFHSSGPIYTGYSESEEIKLYENQESFALEFQLKNEEIIDYIDTQLTGSQCNHIALYIFHLAALSRKILREDRVFYFLPLNP